MDSADIKELQVKEAKTKAKGNMVMARLYLYCLKNNLCPEDAVMNLNSENYKGSITFRINSKNKVVLSNVAQNAFNEKLASEIQFSKREDYITLKIFAPEKDNGNILNGYLLRQLFKYIDVTDDENYFVSHIYDYIRENEVLDFDINQSEIDTYEINYYKDNEIVLEELAFDNKELIESLENSNELNLKIRTK